MKANSAAACSEGRVGCWQTPLRELREPNSLIRCLCYFIGQKPCKAAAGPCLARRPPPRGRPAPVMWPATGQRPSSCMACMAFACVAGYTLCITQAQGVAADMWIAAQGTVRGALAGGGWGLAGGGGSAGVRAREGLGQPAWHPRTMGGQGKWRARGTSYRGKERKGRNRLD